MRGHRTFASQLSAAAPVPGARWAKAIRTARTDPEFDAKAVEWIANGDIDGCVANVSLDSLHAPGNATHGFMDFMLMMGIAGYHKADYADNLDLYHTMEAYFTCTRTDSAHEQVSGQQVPVHDRP